MTLLKGRSNSAINRPWQNNNKAIMITVTGGIVSYAYCGDYNIDYNNVIINVNISYEFQEFRLIVVHKS